MANSRSAGPLGGGNGMFPQSRTPGPLGHNDQGDPSGCSLLGDSPGPLGLFDWGDPTLPLVRAGEQFPPGWLGRSLSGRALIAGAGNQAPAARPGERAVQGGITKAQLKVVFPRALDDFLTQVAAELNTDLAAYDRTPDDRAWFARELVKFGPDLESSQSNTDLLRLEDDDNLLEKIYRIKARGGAASGGGHER